MADNTNEIVNEPKARKRGRPKGSVAKPAPSQDGMFASLLARITDALENQNAIAAQVQKNTPRRRKELTEYKRENAHQFKRTIRPVYQNNRLLDANMLSWEAIEKLDCVAPGYYLGGLKIARTGVGADSRIHLIYSNANIEQRMAFYMMYPSMNKLVDSVLEQMKKRSVAPIFDERPPVVDEWLEEEETAAPVISEAERAAAEREAARLELQAAAEAAPPVNNSQAQLELQAAMRAAGVR